MQVYFKKCFSLNFAKILTTAFSQNNSGSLLKTDLEPEEVCNTFLGKLKLKVKIIEINQFSNFDPVLSNVKDPNFENYLF